VLHHHHHHLYMPIHDEYFLQGKCFRLQAPQICRPSARPHVLLGVTGSVAAIKVPELATQLRQFADVRVVATTSAQHFFTEEQLPAECRPLLGMSCKPSSCEQCSL
jgi:Flavoprotein